MRRIKKIMAILALLAPTFTFSGCFCSPKSAAVVPHPGPTEQPPLQNVDAKRFQQSDTQNKTAVDTAIELSEKYAKLSEEAALLKQENDNLIANNNQLKDRAAALDTQLKQTKKELAEATDLMREMLIDLNSWKSNVLGFRDEMRVAEKTQLEALLQILKILGGETRADSALAENVNLTTETQNQQGQIKYD